MKKYIVPAVEVTALSSEKMIAVSYIIDPTKITTGQLTSGQEWCEDEWVEE